MNEVAMNEAGTLNEIFDALCPPNGSVICPCSSYGLPKITENPRWEDIFVRECGGVPHKAVSGCQPHYPHRHALKDHAEKKKIDEDDDNADESSEQVLQNLRRVWPKPSGAQNPQVETCHHV